jgi:hypothetical protein
MDLVLVGCWCSVMSCCSIRFYYWCPLLLRSSSGISVADVVVVILILVAVAGSLAQSGTGSSNSFMQPKSMGPTTSFNARTSTTCHNHGGSKELRVRPSGGGMEDGEVSPSRLMGPGTDKKHGETSRKFPFETQASKPHEARFIKVLLAIDESIDESLKIR